MKKGVLFLIIAFILVLSSCLNVFCQGLAEVVVEPSLQFDEVHDFIDGLAVVKKDQRYGLVNSSGTIAADCIYESIESLPQFEQGCELGIIEKNSVYGFLNRQGKIVTEPKYKTISKVQNAPFFIVIDDESNYGMVNQAGDLMLPCEYKDLSCEPSGTNEIYLIKVRTQDYLDKTFFVDESGSRLWTDRFQAVTLFEDGAAWVTDINGNSGKINRRGEVVLPFDFTFVVQQAKDSYVTVYNDKEYSVASAANGEKIHSWPRLRTFDVEILSDSAFVVLDLIDDYQLWSPDGRINQKTYYTIMPFYKNLYKVSDKTGFYGLIDESGREVLPCIAARISEPRRGIIEYTDYNKYGCISEDGKMLLEMEYEELSIGLDGSIDAYRTIDDRKNHFKLCPDFDRIIKYSDGHAVLCDMDFNQLSGEYAVIASPGYVPPGWNGSNSYVKIDAPGNQYSLVRNDSWEYGLIDISGNEIIAPEYLALGPVEAEPTVYCGGKKTKGVREFYIFKVENTSVIQTYGPYEQVYTDSGSSMLRVKYENKWTYFDTKQAKFISDFVYDEIYPMNNGLAWTKLGEKWGVVNQNGLTVIDFIYDDVLNGKFYYNYAWVNKSGAWGLIYCDGTQVLDCQYVFGDEPYYHENSGSEFQGVLQNATTNAATTFMDGDAWFYDNGRWGILHDWLYVPVGKPWVSVSDVVIQNGIMSVSINNVTVNSAASVAPVAVLAVYDSNNVLVDNKIKPLENFEAGENQTVVFDLDSIDTQRTYRLFMWDSLETMRPVSVPVDIERNE